MAFRFRLQKLLEYRRTELDQARLRLAHAEDLRVEAEARLARARGEREALDAAFRRSEEQALTPLELRGRVAATRIAQANEERLRNELELGRRLCDQLRAELMERHRAVRTLERLRERRLEEHREEIRAQERKAMDDIQGRKRGPVPPPTATLAPGRG